MAIKSIKLTLNGTVYTLALNSTTGKYEKEITAPNKSSYNLEDHAYPMVLIVTDEAGNTTTIDTTDATFGVLMNLIVQEKTPPTIKMASPTAGAYLTSNSVPIEFTITDADSGVNQNTIKMLVDGSAVTPTITAVTGGYKCTHTETLNDGSHTITVTASDNDGNAATEQTVLFKVDTTPPTLVIDSPSQGLITNKQTIDVSGTTNDATSAPCTVKITLNGVDQGDVAVNADGTFSKSVVQAKGINTIVISSTDQAGKYTEITRTTIYDPDAPVVISIETNPNPVDAGDLFKITVEASD